MKIERILKEPGGARITIGEREYHFAPQDDGRHIAEVEDEGHISILLGITEGYQPANPDDIEPVELEPADPDEPEPVEPEPVDPDEDDDGEDDAPSEFDDLSDDALRDLFEKSVGRKPHPRMLRETMIAQIEAAREEAAE